MILVLFPILFPIVASLILIAIWPWVSPRAIDQLKFREDQVREIYRKRARKYFWEHCLTTLGHCELKWRPLIAKLALSGWCGDCSFRVLDVCTGWGLSMKAVVKRSQKMRCLGQLKVIGIDMTFEMMQTGKYHPFVKPFSENMNFANCLAESLPFLDNSFDSAIAICGFGGIPNGVRATALKEILRVLKPSGQLYILDVTDAPKRTSWQRLLYPLLHRCHIAITERYILRYWGWSSVRCLETDTLSVSTNGARFRILSRFPKHYSEPLYPYAHVQILGFQKTYTA